MATQIGSVVLAGGGTAGHVNPLLSVADELTAREPGIRITALGSPGGLEEDLVPGRGYNLHLVPKVPLPRKPSGAWFSLPRRLKAAIASAGAAMDEIGARAVVGFGGYVSTPAYIAAHRRGIPIVVHEQNARPGLANRLGARWAAQSAVAFPGTALRGAQVTGMPLRHEISALVGARERDRVSVRTAAAHYLGVDNEPPTILVTGGSLGALSLNTAMCGAAGDLVRLGVQVIHLTGKGKAEAVRQVTQGLGERYVVREYLSQMQLAYAVADLVVCRSGAGTVSELAALGIPAIYVPLPIGNGEQRLNARPVVEAGGGLLVDDASFTTQWARENLPPLIQDSGKLAQMAKAAAGAGVRDGASRVADLVAQAAASVGAER